MSYAKQNFLSGDTLYAAQLNAMDGQIAANEESAAAARAHLDKIAGVMGISAGETATVSKELRPDEAVEKYIYNVQNKSTWGPGAEYGYAVYSVRAGTAYKVTGSSASNAEGHPLGAFYDAGGALLSTFGADRSTVYTEYPVTAPENAATMVVNRSIQGQTIAVATEVTLTGSALIDGMVSDVEELDARVDALEAAIAAENAVTPGGLLTPERFVANSIYDVVNKSTYGDSAEYGHAFYSVTGGARYFVTGASARNATNFPMGAFYDADGTLLATFGDDAATSYADELVAAPGNAVRMVVNQNGGTELHVRAAVETADAESAGGAYNLYVADALIREARKNPFRFAALDRGYVSFVFDDLLTDLDSIAATFEEYGYPMGIAAIPDRLDYRATSLTAARGSFKPGMAMREIMAAVAANGGEIMAHNSSPVVSADNQDDYEFMYGYFVQAKRDLEAAGFFPRGLIRAGGDGAISATPQIERWLIGNYEYSNIGTAVNYSQDRVSINRTSDVVKADILDAYNNKRWVRFMCHGYSFGGGATFASEADLRSILDYCKQLGVAVVTYADIFDRFSSSEIQEYMKAHA